MITLFCCLIWCHMTDDDTVRVGNIEVDSSISEGKKYAISTKLMTFGLVHCDWMVTTGS